MPDYSKSVIYKLYDNTNGDTYYGSTCNELRFRIAKHKSAAICDNKSCSCKSKSIILNGDYSYSVVEEYPCESKRQLETRERWWIENNNCVNRRIPTRTHKECDDERYANNKEKEQERGRNYYKNNKEVQSAGRLEYYHKHKEEVKIKRSVKVLCECGILVTKYYLPKHKTTANHLAAISCPPCLPCPPSPQSEPVSSV